jgi:hypothetical protein
MFAASLDFEIEGGIMIHPVGIPEDGLPERFCNRFPDPTVFYSLELVA